MFILGIDGTSDFFRKIFVGIDEGIFWLFEKILVNIFTLAGVEIFEQAIINEVLNRVYVIIGLYVMFKLAFSIITYIISPDKMSNKEQGFGQIITRVIISLTLLVLTPSIFYYARQAQYFILPVIPRVLVGKNFTEGALNADNLNSVAKQMTFQTYLAIFNYNEECLDPQVEIAVSPDEASDSLRVTRIEHVINVVNTECNNPKGIYRYRYIPLASLVLGGFLVYMMLGISIDIAIRAVKLGLLQLVAPIPIMSYIDPKSAKDGAFANWVKNSISTYADLFVRIGVVYLIIFLFDQLFRGNILKNNGSLVFVTIVVGFFFFAKKLPQFLKDILGLKGTGLFKEVFSGHGLYGLAGGIIGGTIAARKKGGSGTVGAVSGGLSAGKQFFSNAIGGKSGGFWKASSKAGEEGQKVNTGWRGRANRASGENRAKAMNLTKDRVTKLKDATKYAERDLSIAQQRLQNAKLRGNNDEIARESKVYDEAYEKYTKVSGRYEQVKAARDNIVQKEPYEEKIKREQKVANTAESTRYRSALRGAREEGRSFTNPYRSDIRSAENDVNSSSDNLRRLENEINYNVNELSRLQDELPDNSMRHYSEKGLFSPNPYKGDIDNLQTHIQDLDSRRGEASNRLADAEDRRIQAEQDFNIAKEISKEVVQDVKNEHKTRRGQSKDPDSDIL